MPHEVDAVARGLTLEESAEEAGIEPPPEFRPGLYHRLLAVFVDRRLMEVGFAERWHALPGGVPWDEQPWWKVEVWHGYLQGEGEGRKQLESQHK